MKTFLAVASVFCGLLGGAVRADPGELRGTLADEKVEAKFLEALKGKDFSGDLELHFDELGITDEREAQSFCTWVINLFLPDGVSCGCNIQWWLGRIILGCQLDEPFCASGTHLGVQIEEVCVEPELDAVYGFDGTVTTEMCDNDVTIDYILPGGTTGSLSLDICYFTDTKLEGCTFTVDGEACGCSFCGSQAIEVDCTSVSALGVLAPFAFFECFYFSLA